MRKKVLGVIPARYQSSRLPGKPLADIGGKPMIQWVYERTLKTNIDKLVVATDDLRIVDAVNKFGGEVVMTDPDHESGTLRLCEVSTIEGYSDYDYFVNIQGDQPLIERYTVDVLVENLLSFAPTEEAVMTLVTDLKDEEAHNPSIAKVVLDRSGKALYFSRAAIPYMRSDAVYKNSNGKDGPYKKHLGVYGFTKATVAKVQKLEPSYLELTEKLEQLTWIYEGIPVYTAFGIDTNKISVDTQEDLDKVREIVFNEINYKRNN